VPRNRIPLIIAAAFGLLAIVIVRMVVSGGGDEDGSDPQAGSRSPRPGCTLLRVVASSEKASLLTSLADEYAASGREVDGQCFDIDVATMGSGSAEAALARGWDEGLDGPQPDIWSPAASTWVGLLQQDLSSRDRPDIVPKEYPSIASTPLVLAMPRPMAQALGWPKKALGWSDLLTLANNPRGWAAKGHPEWGTFKLGKTNPNISTSGLAATVGAFVAATGRSSDLTAKDLEDPKIRRFVADVERAVVHYGDTTLTYLSNLQRADDAGTALGYVSAVAVEEKSVIDYNSGNPTGNLATAGDHPEPEVPLAAIYPKEGTLFSDNPWVVLDAPWASDEKQAGARDFLAFLRTDEAQERFTDAGFRTFEGKAGTVIRDDPNLIEDGVTITLAPPAPSVLVGVRTTWGEVRKRARVLLLLDVSGSMSQAVSEAGATRLQLAKAGIIKAMGQFAPNDEVGVWMFTTGLGSEDGITEELVPVQRLAGRLSEVERAVKSLEPLGGTPLYASIRVAVAEMRSGFAPDKINAVVVLTDGRNEYADDNDLDGLVRQLGGYATENPLRVFSIAYSSGADLDVLREISEASQAAAYDATDPESIDKVMTAVISNF
jgi:Ca-activated chloride channel homolog